MDKSFQNGLRSALTHWYPGGPTIVFPVDSDVDSCAKVTPLPTDIEVTVDKSADVQKLSTKLSTYPQVVDVSNETPNAV